MGQVSWRSRYAKQASRFLEPGERIQSVFATAVRDNYGLVLYFPAFVVTDRAIIEIDRQFITGRLTEVVARHPRNIRLGPLTGRRRTFRLGNIVYEVPRKCANDVAAADAALTEQATLDPHGLGGQQPLPADSAAAVRQMPHKNYWVLRVGVWLIWFFVIMTALSNFLAGKSPFLDKAAELLIVLVVVGTPLGVVTRVAYGAIHRDRERHRSGSATPPSGGGQPHLLWGVLWIVGGFFAGFGMVLVGEVVASRPVVHVLVLCALIVWLVCGTVAVYLIVRWVLHAVRCRRATRTTAGA